MKYINFNKEIFFKEIINCNGYDIVFELLVTNILSRRAKQYIFKDEKNELLNIDFEYLENLFVINFDDLKIIDITKEFNKHGITYETHNVYGSYAKRFKNIYLIVSIEEKKGITNNQPLSLSMGIDSI